MAIRYEMIKVFGGQGLDQHRLFPKSKLMLIFWEVFYERKDIEDIIADFPIV